MTYYGAKDLADSFRTVRKNTIAVAEDIPENQYGFRAAPETRTVAQSLVHIAVAPRMPQQIHRVEKRTTLEGFNFPGFFEGIVAEDQKPRSKAEIVALLHTEGDAMAQWLEGLTDDFLAARDVATGNEPRQQNAIRDAAERQGARDAPPRPVDGERTDAGHCAAPDALDAGAYRGHASRNYPNR